MATVNVNISSISSKVQKEESIPICTINNVCTVRVHAKWNVQVGSTDADGHNTSYKVLPEYYISSQGFIGDSYKVTITKLLQGGLGRVGFNSFGHSYLIDNGSEHDESDWKITKKVNSLTDTVRVGYSTQATIDVTDTFVTKTKSGALTYAGFEVTVFKEGEEETPLFSDRIYFHFSGTFYGSKPLVKYTIIYLNDDGSPFRQGHMSNIDRTSSEASTSINYTIWSEYPEKSTKPYSASGSGKYQVNYSSAGKTKDYSYSWTQSISRNWKCWTDENGKEYSPTKTYTLTSDIKLTATYNVKDGDKNFTYSTLNYFPTAQKFGYYDSTNWRYSDDYSGGGHSYSKGSPASMGDYVVTNETLYTEFQPKSYRIMYRTVDRNNVVGWTSDLDAGQPKTFGSSSVALINPELTRTGYKFDGWINEDAYKKLGNGNQTIYTSKKYSWYYGYKDKSGKKTTDDEEAHIHGVGDSVNSNKLLKSVKLGGDGVEASSTPEYDVPAQKSSNIRSFDDTYYKKLASISSPDGFTVPLNAIWSYNENLLKLRYYDEPRNDNDTNPFDDPVRETNFFYNIDSNGFELNSPYEIDTSKSKPESIKNYVFYGWINADDLTNEAVKWWTETHGMFINPRQLLKGLTDAGVTVKPGTIIMKASDIRKIGSAAEYGSWDTTKFYYGFWVGSSKFVKINKVWRRIAEVFVKKDNKWEPVDVIRIQIDDGVSPSTAKYPYTRNDYKWKMEEVVVKNYNSLNS